ncbi:MAG: glycosyltransferase family 4 protein [Anaerolineales bacterium]|nr:glycosyltransferase family 4 protein [Anaerolineales bacterium]
MRDNKNENKNKRHCMVVHAYYPLGETRVERQALALVKHGYEVDVICLWARKGPEFETRDGVNIYRLPVKRDKSGGSKAQLLEYLTFFVLASRKLASLHWRHRYGTVQVHNLPDFLVFAGLIPKLMGAKLILDIHDLMPEFYAARFKNSNWSSWPIRLIRWQEQISCRFANKVITVTELWRNTLIQRGVPAEKVCVVMNVADDRIFQRPSINELSARNNDRFRLIYHGNITQRYGIDSLVRAVNLVRYKIPNIHLMIHGGGDYRETLMKLVDELDLKEHVQFSSGLLLPSSELPNLIRTADVGVVPYRRDIFTDGILPTKLMEYTALGVPSIVARTPAIEAYFDETMVEYFTPENVDELAASILKLYDDPVHRATLAKNADSFNQRYNWTKLSVEYVGLIDALHTQRARDIKQQEQEFNEKLI